MRPGWATALRSELFQLEDLILILHALETLDHTAPAHGMATSGAKQAMIFGKRNCVL